MRVAFEERAVAGAPLLIARRADAPEPPPLVLWYHGWGASKEAHRAELARVASAGFLAVGVDAVGHGARRWPDWDARLDAARAGPPGAVFRLMLAAAEASAAEVPALLDALGTANGAAPARASLVGISLGGYLAYRAAAANPGLRAVVALLGSPEWPDAPLPAEAFHHTALLSVTAERDASVPPDGARRLHEALARTHPDPSRTRHVELADAEHLMNAEQWARAMDETLAWLLLHGA